MSYIVKKISEKKPIKRIKLKTIKLKLCPSCKNILFAERFSKSITYFVCIEKGYMKNVIFDYEIKNS